MKIDRNIEVHGNSIRVVFQLGKVRCREKLNLIYTPENLKKAKLIRDDIESDIRRNKFCYADYFPNSKRRRLFEVKSKSYLLKDLFEQQIEYIEANKKYSKFTKRDYKTYILSYLIPAFGKIAVTELTALAIKKWILASTQGAYFVNNVLIQLRATLADAQNDGLIAESPLNKLDIKRLLQQLEDNSDYEINPFNLAERRMLLDNTTGEIKNLIQFGLFSGLRIGEILALKWENVDLANSKLKIVFTMNKGTLERPKTPESKREIILLDRAFEALESQKNYKSKDGFVFHNPNTNKYWTETDSFRKHWVKLFENLTIKYRNPYQMRHTFASMLISNGENIHKVAKYLGHKNIKMIIEIYGKFIPEESNNGLFTKKYNEE